MFIFSCSLKLIGGDVSRVGVVEHRLRLVLSFQLLHANGSRSPAAGRSSGTTSRVPTSLLSCDGQVNVPLEDKDDEDVDALQHVDGVDNVPVDKSY